MKMHHDWRDLCALLCVTLLNTICFASDLINPVAIRIINEATNYRSGAYNPRTGLKGGPHSRSPTLNLKHQAANFSGPSQLGPLVGKCFDYSDTHYKYTVCPFANITQTELRSKVTPTWEPPFRGILGVWSGNWRVDNYSFSGLEFDSGDACDDLERETLLRMTCDPDESKSDRLARIVSVDEPTKCRYDMVMQSKLMCHQHAALVYPRLPTLDLRQRWDVLETKLDRGQLTLDSYDLELKQILVDAGFRKEAKRRHVESTVHRDLRSCNSAVAEKDDQIAELMRQCPKLRSN